MRIQIISTNTGYEVTDMQTGRVMGKFDSLQYAKDCKDELEDQLAHKYGLDDLSYQDEADAAYEAAMDAYDTAMNS
jgi:hypothetical protein